MIYQLNITGIVMRRLGLYLAILLVIIASSNVQAAEVPPKPDEEGIWVIDSAQVLSSTQFDILNEKCNQIYLESGKPIVVLTIESYQDQGAEGWDKEGYARFAFDEYGINDDNNENKAILIFMSEQDRQFWTELGGGFSNEGWSGYVQEVFDYDVRPYLSENMWYEGLNAAVEGMERIVNQGEITYPEWDKVADDSTPNWIIDEAGLIVDVDENDINLRINAIEENTNCSILIVTIDGLSGKNASFIGPYQYTYGAFQNYDLDECDILWLIITDSDAWGTYWDVQFRMGAEYNSNWIDYMNDKQWNIFDELDWGGGEVDDFLLHEIVDYSEKAILNDGFNMDEWIEINTPFLVLLPIMIALSVGIFMRSIPKKIKFRKGKEEALENIALVNRNIMANIGGNSSIRNNWNGKFEDMTDSEIKSFRRLDDKLSKNDVEISLEKYENELKQIKEVYNLRTNKSDNLTLLLLFLCLPIGLVILWGLDLSQANMEAKMIGLDAGLETLFLVPFLLFPLVIIFLPLKGILTVFSGGDIKSEMGLILGIPIMSSKSSLPVLSTSGRYNMSEHEYDRLVRELGPTQAMIRREHYERYGTTDLSVGISSHSSFSQQDYHWTYDGMERSGNSFRRSSGSTSSERASSSSGGGGFDSGGGGGGFDSGGSGGGGGGGGDF